MCSLSGNTTSFDPFISALITAATAVYLSGLLLRVKVSLPALLRRDDRENIENQFWPVRGVPLACVVLHIRFAI
jgi:hypothetical protein